MNLKEWQNKDKSVFDFVHCHDIRPHRLQIQ